MGVVCLIGIIAIFFFDAYIGVYDTLYVEEGWEREIAFDKSYPNLHIIMYGLSCITGLCTFTFFLTMDIPKPIKIMASIIAGMILIFIASWMQKAGKKRMKL